MLTESSKLSGDIEALSVWVGRIALESATDQHIYNSFRPVGKITAVKIRIKDGANKCWAVVSFEEAGGVTAATSPSQLLELGCKQATCWKVERLERGRFKSLQAKMVDAKHQLKHDLGGRTWDSTIVRHGDGTFRACFNTEDPLYRSVPAHLMVVASRSIELEPYVTLVPPACT
jgi:hypothetical protein